MSANQNPIEQEAHEQEDDSTPEEHEEELAIDEVESAPDDSEVEYAPEDSEKEPDIDEGEPTQEEPEQEDSDPDDPEYAARKAEWRIVESQYKILEHASRFRGFLNNWAKTWVVYQILCMGIADIWQFAHSRSSRTISRVFILVILSRCTARMVQCRRGSRRVRRIGICSRHQRRRAST